MTISEMTEVVKNALNEYRKAKATNNKTIIERAVNEMENVYIKFVATLYRVLMRSERPFWKQEQFNRKVIIVIPNIDSKPTMKPFKDVSGIFVTVNFDGNYLTWVKIPEVFDSNAAKGWNAYCFDNNSLSYFRYDTLVTDPTNVNMKVEF